MSRGRSLAAACALAAALAAALTLATTAPAAVTIGSDLAAAPTSTASDQTLTSTVIPGQTTAAPIDGVIHVWRLKTAPSAGVGVRLRVIRPLGSGFAEGAGTGPTETATGGVQSFAIGPTGLPIEAGDWIGIDNGTGPGVDGATVLASTSGAATELWNPFLPDGEAQPTGPLPNLELLLNADVEPDADCDGLGDETQDPSVAADGCGLVAPPPPPPTDSDLLELKAAKRKPLKRLAVRASCFADCRVKVMGTVKAAGERFKLRPRTTRLRSDEIRRIGLRVKRARKRARLTGLVAEGERAVARIVGVARAFERVERERVKVRLIAPRKG